MSDIIAYQLPLRPALPTVYGPLDYREYRRQFELIDELLLAGNLVEQFIDLSIEHSVYEEKSDVPKSFIAHSECALRCNIARILLGESFRKFSQHLADSQVLQWFCRVGDLTQVKVPAKSTLQRYVTHIPSDKLDELVYGFLAQCGIDADEDKKHVLGLEESINFDDLYLDATCLEANIHFPVDWVLLLDAVRTLMKATLLIRERGLKHRMRAPEKFISEMNALGIQMANARRKTGAKKQRKKALRLMKTTVDKVARHARKHNDLLIKHGDETDFYPGEIKQIVARIDSILEQLPAAKKQAHERIIGERKVANEDKLFSLYEADVNIIVRNKAGKEVEFGNLLTLVEQQDGLIVGWHLHQELTSDQNYIPTALDAVQEGLGKKIKRLFTDRGYNGPINAEYLQEQEIYNGICPKNPQELKRRKHSSVFANGQKRRAQTEGRIGIFKNVFLSNPMKSKGFERRKLTVSWAALTHNLWVIARKLREQEREALEQAA